jgi:glycosyltransferase involved in cell wall biosynthesis
MHMHGQVRYEDVPRFLNSLDVFVFPTLGEGFGLPVCEAMACGVPVVASNVTTMPELVGKSGLLAKPDVKNMSAAIEKLVESRPLRKRLGKSGMKRAREFTWKKAAQETLGIYRSVSK